MIIVFYLYLSKNPFIILDEIFPKKVYKINFFFPFLSMSEISIISGFTKDQNRIEHKNVTQLNHHTLIFICRLLIGNSKGSDQDKMIEY